MKLYKKAAVSEEIMPMGKNFSYKKFREAQWLGLTVIDTFFSWTEHLFIHLSVIAHGMHDGKDITKLIGAEWKAKFKKAIELDNPEICDYYDRLILVKSQIRNFVTHGAFGKNGEAFTFHSGTGAVPVSIVFKKNNKSFAFSGTTGFKDEEVLGLIDRFIKYLWNRNLGPAMEYAQHSHLPSVLTLAESGSYASAMESIDAMNSLIAFLNHEFDNAGNMDW